MSPNINGPWLSKEGQLVYIITQVNDKFVWRVVHENGVIETGIGLFTNNANNEDNSKVSVEVQWNYHGGVPTAKVHPPCKGFVIIDQNKNANEIHWDDWDDFQRIS